MKSSIINFWEQQLRSEAQCLSSLVYFKPEFMSLLEPHPVWSTCGSNPFEVNKAVIQARMLSGRYITDQLSRHWTSNKSGICSLPSCTGQAIGSLEHILLHCPSLSSMRIKMINLSTEVSKCSPVLEALLASILNDTDHTKLMQFLLDCSALPEVVILKQEFGLQPLMTLFYISRTWCYNIHRSRMTQLGLFKYR